MTESLTDTSAASPASPASPASIAAQVDSSATGSDFGQRYNRARLRLTAALQTLDETTVTSTIPATPKWTPRDLAAHVAGVVSDLAQGRLEGAGSDEWTALQVASAAEESLDDILARWAEQAPALEQMLSAAPPSVSTARLVIDLITHEFDLAGLTGQVPELGEEFEFALNGFASTLAYRIRKAGLATVQLSAGMWSYVAGDGEPTVRASSSQVEIFRALSGRRSEAQVRDWAWEGDPTPYLPVISMFGALSETDVIERF